MHLPPGGLVDGIIFCSNNELQEIAQVLVPIYEPKYSDGSYGYIPQKQMKDLHAGDIMIYPKHTSLCIQND